MRPIVRRKTSFGAAGRRFKVRPASRARRFSLRELQRLHAATTLSQVCWPPRDRGMTWSTFSAGEPQYWHTQSSRAKTARRVRAERDVDEVAQAHDRGSRELETLGPEHDAVRCQDDRLLLEHENDRSP